MIKILAGVLVLGIVAFMGFMHFTPGAQSPKESIEKAIIDAKATSNLNLNPEQETLLKVQLAISDYMSRNGQPPDSLRQLVPTYFETEPVNPITGAPFDYQRVGKSPKLGGQLSALAKNANGRSNKDSTDLVALLGSAEGFVNPNTIKPENYNYDPTGKRDPFVPYTPQADPAATDSSPLTTYSIGQLRVAAILTSANGDKKAIVEDEQGKGYTVSKDTVIGKEHGVVAEIEEKALKIVVTKKDFAGNDKEEVVTMELNHGSPAGQRKGNANAKNKAKR